MILVTVGSQRFQFNRLLIKIDEMIDKGIIKEPVFAQIGVSDYKPKNYEYIDFLNQNEFNNQLELCDLVITHAGTGVIVTALKKEKKVIALPRLAKFGEHVDDHQIQLIDEFKDLNFIEPAYNIDDLENALKLVKTKKYKKYISNSKTIIEDIKKYLEE